MAKLDAARIYQKPEVEGLVADYLANMGNNALTKWVTRPGTASATGNAVP